MGVTQMIIGKGDNDDFRPTYIVSFSDKDYYERFMAMSQGERQTVIDDLVKVTGGQTVIFPPGVSIKPLEPFLSIAEKILLATILEEWPSVESWEIGINDYLHRVGIEDPPEEYISLLVKKMEWFLEDERNK